MYLDNFNVFFSPNFPVRGNAFIPTLFKEKKGSTKFMNVSSLCSMTAGEQATAAVVLA